MHPAHGVKLRNTQKARETEDAAKLSGKDRLRWPVAALVVLTLSLLCWLGVWALARLLF